jgi:hypothetical protein
MKPEDRTTAAQTVAFVERSAVNPLAAVLINAPKPTTENLLKRTPPKAVDDPSVAADVLDLAEIFTPSDSERTFVEEKQYAEYNARMAATKDEKGAPKNFLQSHMVIIDQLLMNPGISTTDLSVVTGYSRHWLHKVMSSDAFQAKLGERQKAICDPIILNAIKDRLNGVASRSLEIIETRLESDKVSLESALTVFDAMSRSLGLGQVKTAAVNQFVVHIPTPVANAKAWAEQYGSAGESAQTIDAASGVAGETLASAGAVIREVADGAA